jgi:hypothetical protein
MTRVHSDIPRVTFFTELQKISWNRIVGVNHFPEGLVLGNSGKITHPCNVEFDKSREMSFQDDKTLRRSGILNLRSPEVANLRRSGILNLRSLEVTNLRSSGILNLQSPEVANLRRFEILNLRSLEVANPRRSGIWNP